MRSVSGGEGVVVVSCGVLSHNQDCACRSTVVVVVGRSLSFYEEKCFFLVGVMGETLRGGQVLVVERRVLVLLLY